MSRPIGSKNEQEQPKIIEVGEADRLEYLAALLLETVEEDLRNSEASHAA